MSTGACLGDCMVVRNCARSVCACVHVCHVYMGGVYPLRIIYSRVFMTAEFIKNGLQLLQHLYGS